MAINVSVQHNGGSRDEIIRRIQSGNRGKECPALTTNRIGNPTWLIHTLLEMLDHAHTQDSTLNV